MANQGAVLPDAGQPGRFTSSRHVLLDQLGSGDMGQVVRAYDRLTQQTIALKSRPQGGGDAVRLTLAQEFQTLATFRHPNIISVLDYGFAADGRPFFTMELLSHLHTAHTLFTSLGSAWDAERAHPRLRAHAAGGREADDRATVRESG